MSEQIRKCPYCAQQVEADAVECGYCGSTLPEGAAVPDDTPDSPPADAPAVDMVLSSRYRIIRELGRGSMGAVCLAHDDELDMDVAIKFLPAELANEQHVLELLHAEARLYMSLDHHNITRLHKFDTSGQLKFFVLEYVNGANLLEILSKKGRLILEEALPLIETVCEGIEYAHSMRVLHRDLKPANIMLTMDGEVKITNFGIAHRMHECMDELSQEIIASTPKYTAPERIMGERPTVRSDIYSLGALAYELLAGHPPFYHGDIIDQIRSMEPPPIVGVPDSTNAAVLAALAKDPGRRPASATAFHNALIGAPVEPDYQPETGDESLAYQDYPGSVPGVSEPEQAPEGDAWAAPLEEQYPAPVEEAAWMPAAEPPGVPEAPYLERDLSRLTPPEFRLPDAESAKHRGIRKLAYILGSSLTAIAVAIAYYTVRMLSAVAGLRKSRKLRYVLILIVLIGAAAAYYLRCEQAARAQFAEIKRNVDAALEGVKETEIDLVVERKLTTLRQKVEKWRDDHFYSIMVMRSAQIGEVIDSLRSWEEKISTNRRMHTRRAAEKYKGMYHDAREAQQNGDYVKALSIYRGIDTAVVPELTEKIYDRVELLRNYLQKAKNLYNDALENQKHALKEMEPELWQNVHLKLLKLLKEYKDSPLVSEVKLPLLVKSSPGGADVEVAGEIVGQTPRVHFRKPGHLLRVRVTRRGYGRPPFKIVKDSDWHAYFTLVKAPIWTFRAKGFIESAPVADNKEVYFGTRSGVVYAVELATGKEAWSFTPESVFKPFVASPMVDSGKLYIGSLNQHLYALDTQDGARLWSMQLDSPVRSSPSAMSRRGVFYIGCSDKKVYAIDSKNQAKQWEFPTGAEVLSSPVLRRNVIYVGSNDNNIYAIEAYTGESIWSFKTLGYVTGRPSFYRNRKADLDLVIFGSSDNAVYALHTDSELPEDQGRAAWTAPTGGAVTSTPFVDGDSVYVTSGDGKLYCLDASTGNRKWSFSTPKSLSASPVVADGVVYFGGTDGCFYAVSAGTHQELWKFKTQSEILGAACVSGEYIIVGSTDSTLYCFIKN